MVFIKSGNQFSVCFCESCLVVKCVNSAVSLFLLVENYKRLNFLFMADIFTIQHEKYTESILYCSITCSTVWGVYTVV